MSDADDGGIFGDDDTGADFEPAGRPRRLLLILGIVMAGFVFIGVAGATLIFYFVLRVRDHTDPNHGVRAKYSNRYARCVQDGGAAGTCASQVLLACEKDSWWTQPSRAGQRETVCLATVPD